MHHVLVMSYSMNSGLWITLGGTHALSCPPI
jgi:hypothetical protein